MTFVDPCGLTAMLAGKKRNKQGSTPFWETNGYAAVGNRGEQSV